MGKGRAACCDKSKVKKGAWSPKEDLILTTFIRNHGHSNWRTLPLQAGLLRCGKSCRLRWINYLRPDVKRGSFTPQEELTIINLHYSFGNKWSKIASHLPGRTDNEIKNVWNTHLKKRVMMITKKNIAADNININIGSKTNYSSSSSCSITTSSGDHQEKMDKAILDHHQDSGGPNNSEKPKSFLDLKKSNENEPSVSDDHSPTSSSYSSNYRLPNEALECSIDPNDHHDGKIEIPLEESDVDFWELFDSLDELHNTGNHGSDLSNGGNENHGDVGIEGGEWNIRLLENELGLTGDDDVDNLPKDDDDQNVVLTTQQQYYEEMHMERGIFPGILLDYFQI